MNRMLRYTIVGPNAGKSGEWGGKKFVNGIYEHLAPSEFDVPTHAKLLDRSLANYGAYREGTSAYEGAVSAYEAVLAGAVPAPIPAAEPVPAPVDDGVEPKATEFTNEKLVAAIRGLDPNNPKLWTKDGRPFLGPIEKAYGQSGLTRQIIEDAVPGWNRAVAMEEAQKLASAGEGEDTGEQSGAADKQE